MSKKNKGPDTGLVTRRDLARQLGIVIDTLSKWERQGMPVAVAGRGGRPSWFREADVRAWLQAREEAAKQSDLYDVAQERARKERAQATLAEQSYQIRAREYLPVAEIEQALSARVAATRAKLLAWGTTLTDRVYRASVVDGLPGVERVLTEAVHEVLRELSTMTVAPPTPTGTDQEPVA